MTRAILLCGTVIGALMLMPLTLAAEPVPQPAARHRMALSPACGSAADCDRADYDYSGSRGRMGLGADPAHPEGPGNTPN